MFVTNVGLCLSKTLIQCATSSKESDEKSKMNYTVMDVFGNVMPH